MKRGVVGLSSSMERGLKMYALAARAAGVGVLALAQPAEARIVYTKTNCILGNGRTGGCLIDFGLDGGKFVVFYNHFENGVGGRFVCRQIHGRRGSSHGGSHRHGVHCLFSE